MQIEAICMARFMIYQIKPYLFKLSKSDGYLLRVTGVTRFRENQSRCL
jgi:hypothetical protein